LSNFIGYLVKGKDISLEASIWRKVPAKQKEKLWESVKAFFIVDESFKPWVMKSASKKFRTFKTFLKKKFFNSKLTIKQNIDKGCGKRIPPKQWASLVKNWKTSKAEVLY
jgi:hypothetical protein